VVLPAFVHEAMQPAIGDPIELHIYYSVSERQPLPILVGFRDAGDREFFEQFIQVEGIGPARAANALTMPVPTLAYAIETEDLVTLTLMPGIGHRGAQKIVATLRGKVSEAARRPIVTSAQRDPRTDTRADVVAVLVNLGHRNTEAVAMVDGAIRRDPENAEDAQALLRDIFRNNPLLSTTTQ
jgi:Holliday junction DNA helicase RuvA